MGKNIIFTFPRLLPSRGRSLAILLFLLLFIVVVFAVIFPAFSTAGAIDGQVRRAANIEMCSELRRLIDHWEGDIDGYLASTEVNTRHDGRPLDVQITSGTKLRTPQREPSLLAQFRCDEEIALAESNGIAPPALFEADSGGSELLGARIEEQQSGGGVRWAEIRIDMGGTLKAVIRSQFILASATLAVALVLGALAARFIGRQVQQSVDSMNSTLEAFTRGNRKIRVPGDRRDIYELIELKSHVNAALEDIADQTEARETAAKQIVHDIRSPLGKVEMWLRPHTGTDAKIARALEIVTEVIEGTRLILIGLTGDPRNVQRVPLSQAIASQADDYKMLAESQGVTFAISIAPDIAILGSKDSVNRLIGNLLQNVIDHGAPGTAVLDLRSDGTSFRLAIENDRELSDAETPVGNFGIGQASVRDIATRQGWTFTASVADDRYGIVVTGPIARGL